MPRATRIQKQSQTGEVSINMTPVIDCVFLLIVFFTLAGQFSSQSLAKVELYEPVKSQALKWNEKDPNRVIVNIPSRAETAEDDADLADQALGYLIGGRKIEANELADHLRAAANPYLSKKLDFFVEIRADRRVRYADVEPILWAAAEAKIPKLNLTALLATRKTK